jgi:hypothetical protein
MHSGLIKLILFGNEAKTAAVMVLNWLAAGQVKSRDSKGYETAFYWETAVDEKVLRVDRGQGGRGCVAAQAHRVL